ncbi:MAG TPA: hypothetical protein VLS52_05130, partial [Rudaea sp.]|nr:hypothetical protein [Rudaea sp.]
MNAALEIGIEGIGVWARDLPDWQVARGIFMDNAAVATIPAARPPATALAPGERRRAPESVLIAVEAAQQACAMADR